MKSRIFRCFDFKLSLKIAVITPGFVKFVLNAVAWFNKFLSVLYCFKNELIKENRYIKCYFFTTFFHPDYILR